jgi:thioredoxin 1
MAVVKADSNSFAKEVENHKGVVLVDFYADWCGPCVMMAPIVEELSEEMKDVKFVKVNVDENPDLAQKYGVFSIPTFVIFKDGQKVGEFVGARDKASFKSEIEKYS